MVRNEEEEGENKRFRVKKKGRVIKGLAIITVPEIN
jgi:hypothetical protein